MVKEELLRSDIFYTKCSTGETSSHLPRPQKTLWIRSRFRPF